MTLAALPLGWITDGLPSASGVAPHVDRIMGRLLGAALVMCVGLTVITLIILVRYRRGAKVNRAPLRVPTWKIELAWSLGTLAIFLWFFVQGVSVYSEMERVPAGLPEISVTGRQWMWDVRYADGRREFNVLHVRLNTPVRIVLSSEDVIHSFFVPALRVKQDLVPGRIVSTWFKPTRLGTYPLYCAQYCGTAHAQMLGQVVVLDEAAYAAWRRQPRLGNPALLAPAPTPSP